MYLKRLELLGFKSFADKIKLEFMPGVTAVVGPNGSGKSNISDALRWVLGEQSIKNLRGAKMDDVIFAGTELRKALGLAEVTIVLDNSDHSIPLDFSEVSITRKLFRSGESEYLINKSQVRLKDILELFYDTGLGKDAYSVISQGKIDSILSVKAEERRSIFEEAAGIIKYKSRKQIAERKLEDTDKNLVRVQDIINELQSQLGPLESQADLAQKYLQMKERLSTLEINHYGKIIKVLEDELLTVQRNKAETEEKFRDFEGEANIIDSKLEEIRLQVLNMDQRINDLNEAYFRIQNTIDKYTEQSGFLHTKLNDLAQEEAANAQGMTINEERKAALLTEESSLETETLEITNRLAAEQAALQTEEEGLKGFNETLKSLEDQEQELKNELIEVLNRIAALKNRQNSTSLQKDFLSKQTEECHRKEALLTAKQGELLSEKAAKEGELQKIADQIEEAQRLRADLLLQMNADHQEIISGEEKNQESRQRIRTLEGKISLLEDMEKSFQGYFQGVKSLLADSAGERFHSKIRGIVADLIHVKAGMELALETALGSSLQHIVIEDDQAAQDAIAFLKRKSKGRATFLPLNRVKAYESRHPNLQAILKQYSCHTAVSLLEYDPQYQQVIQYLLNQVIVAPDLRVAIAVSTKLDRGFRIVTPEGDLVNPGGSITGGSTDRHRVGLLSRKREIEDLKQEKNELEIALNRNIAELAAMQKTMEEKRAKVEELKAAENDARLLKVAAERDLNTLTQNLDRVSSELDDIAQQLTEFAEENDKFESGTEELSQAIEAGESRLKEIEQALEDLAESLNTAKQNKETQLQKIVELKSKVSAGTQELQGKQVFKANLAKQMAELERAMADLQVKHQDILEKRRQTQETLSELEIKVTEEQVNLARQYDLINTEKTVKEDLQAKIKELEGKQRSFRRRNNDFQNQLHRMEMVITQKSTEIENLRQNLAEDYGLEWENAFDATWEPPADVATLINNLKTEIRELGLVNIAAIEDYRQVKQRCEFLTSQAQDLVKAKNSLQKVIAEIERTIEKRFIETFDRIRTEFRKIFSELFAGGSADLYLLEPENVLESGIEIIAQPPGKKLQSLSLLSGGERAMTAIALLFSILAIRPAPFCILDEIDATLDEVNVQRFARLLELFSKDLQFIVVTHRRGTMEAANTIYGVTMEEMGISKLISLDLSDKATQSA